MVDKRLIIIVLLTLLLLTGCGKKANNTYTINSNNDTYVNGNSTSTTTTTTTPKEPITTTTRETTTVKRIAYVSQDNRGPSTNEVLDEAKNNVSIRFFIEKYLGKIYSYDTINIITQMLYINETTRKDFIELEQEFSSLGY